MTDWMRKALAKCRPLQPQSEVDRRIQHMLTHRQMDEECETARWRLRNGFRDLLAPLDPRLALRIYKRVYMRGYMRKRRLRKNK